MTLIHAGRAWQVSARTMYGSPKTYHYYCSLPLETTSIEQIDKTFFFQGQGTVIVISFRAPMSVEVLVLVAVWVVSVDVHVCLPGRLLAFVTVILAVGR